MTRDHMMGFAPVALSAAAVDEEGEDYFANYDALWGSDPYPHGVPHRFYAEQHKREAAYRAERAAINSFNTGEHLPDADVYERSNEEIRRMQKALAAHLREREEARKVADGHGLSERPQQPAKRAPQVPALFKVPEGVSAAPARKRWDVLHAQQEAQKSATLAALMGEPPEVTAKALAWDMENAQRIADAHNALTAQPQPGHAVTDWLVKTDARGPGHFDVIHVKACKPG